MNPHPAFHLLPAAVYGFFCFEILGRFTIKLSLARALIVTTGASRLSGRSRSFSYPPFDPFSVAYTEYRNANLWHIFLRITVKILLQTFPCRNQNSTFCSGRLRPAKLQHGTKNSSDSNDVSDMFSSFSLQTLCISWCCCLRLLVSVPLPVPVHLSAPNTGLYSHDTGNTLLRFDIDGGQMAACVFIYPIYFLSGGIVDGVEKRAGHESGVRNPLWKCELAYYWNLNVNSAAKRSQRHDWNMWAADWCRALNAAPLKAKFHSGWARISFDIRWRWQSSRQSCVLLNCLQKSGYWSQTWAVSACMHSAI